MEKPIFKSKRFVSAFVGLIIMILVAFIPELAAYEETLVEAITTVVLALIAGYSATDILLTWLKN